MKGEAPDVLFSSDGQELFIENRIGPSYVWNLSDKILSEQIVISPPHPFAVEMHNRGYSQNWLSAFDGKVVFQPRWSSSGIGK